jgi:hypothetical protein
VRQRKVLKFCCDNTLVGHRRVLHTRLHTLCGTVWRRQLSVCVLPCTASQSAALLKTAGSLCVVFPRSHRSCVHSITVLGHGDMRGSPSSVGARRWVPGPGRMPRQWLVAGDLSCRYAACCRLGPCAMWLCKSPALGAGVGGEYNQDTPLGGSVSNFI